MKKFGFGLVGMSVLSFGLVSCGTNSEKLERVSPEEKISPYELKYIELFPQWSEHHRYHLAVPDFNLTPAQVSQAGQSALRKANIRIEELAAKEGALKGFDESFGALDRMYFELESVWSPLYLMKETSANEQIRQAASEQSVAIEQWLVGLYANPKLYRSLKTASKSLKKLNPEQKKFVNETLRNFERAGMALSPEALAEVTALKKEHAALQEAYQKNIKEASAVLTFQADELEGLPEDFVKSKTSEDGSVSIDVAVTYEFLMLAENASREDVRRRAKVARYSIAQEPNTKILQQLVELRDKIASRLGYESWADYRIEVNMAETQAAVVERLEQMTEAFEPKFQAELQEMKALKLRDAVERPETVESEDFHIWDFRYYQDELKKAKYDVDTSELNNYFPMEGVKSAVFKTFGDLFGLEFISLEAPYKWVEDLEFYVVLDSETKAPLGLFYLDLYPRPNKYSHFAHFGIIPGRKTESGVFRRPVSALVCNFPRPIGDAPSLLTHDHVETFFHEFGHLMHSMLGQSSLASFSGTAVERDFVEAPSQMFEAWAWNYDVLSSFARHYQRPEETISKDLLDRMKEARLGTVGFWYRRQLSLGLMDVWFHGKGRNKDVVEITERAFEEIFLPAPENTMFAANFGHMAGYDSGYYGYAWADAISQDLLSAFEETPEGLLNTEVGRRLRKEIYEVGGSRSASESVEAFLGRPYNLDAFEKNYGLLEEMPGPEDFAKSLVEKAQSVIKEVMDSYGAQKD